MNLVWFFSYLADAVFMLLYFRQENYSSDYKKTPWLKPLFLILMMVLYLPSLRNMIPATVRVIVRTALFFCYQYWCERIPFQTSVYISVFWSAICTLFQNIFFGPYFNPVFTGEAFLISSPIANQIVLSAIGVSIRLIYYSTIAFFVPFSAVGNVNVNHIIFIGSILLFSMYAKASQQVVIIEIIESPIQFFIYFILLHLALLILLVAFDNYRRRTQELASLAIQSTVAQALLEKVRDRQQSEEAIRSLRHDLKNHAIALQLLLEQGKTDEAVKYLETFRIEVGATLGNCHTGNDLLDGLLQQKLSHAIEQGVTTKVALDFRLGGFISDFDLCTLMGNILDNALEACAKVPTEKRFLKISGGQAANCLLVQVENACPSKMAANCGLPITTKADKVIHGFGLKNVKRVLDQYGGNLTIINDIPGAFTLSMLIPIPDMS